MIAWAQVLVDETPGVLGHISQVSVTRVIAYRRIRRLVYQGLQTLIRGWIFEMVEPVQGQSFFNRTDISSDFGNLRLVNLFKQIGGNQSREDAQDNDHDHNLDQGKTARPIVIARSRADTQLNFLAACPCSVARVMVETLITRLQTAIIPEWG